MTEPNPNTSPPKAEQLFREMLFALRDDLRKGLEPFQLEQQQGDLLDLGEDIADRTSVVGWEDRQTDPDNRRKRSGAGVLGALTTRHAEIYLVFEPLTLPAVGQPVEPKLLFERVTDVPLRDIISFRFGSPR